MIPNCLSEGETLADLARRECAIGFDLRFCRSVAVSEHDRDTETCDPTEAEFATIYALTDLGEAIAIHDADLTSAGADEVATIARALRPARRRPAPRGGTGSADRSGPDFLSQRGAIIKHRYCSELPTSIGPPERWLSHGNDATHPTEPLP